MISQNQKIKISPFQNKGVARHLKHSLCQKVFYNKKNMLAFNMTSVHLILSKMGWSDEQMEHQGDLMLSAPLGKLSVCAATLLRKNEITARIRSTDMATLFLSTNLEIHWSLDGDNAQLSQFKINEKDQPLHEERALKIWQHSVQRLHGTVKFQRRGLRHTPQHVAPNLKRQPT